MANGNARYPTLQAGHSDRQAITRLQQRLNETGCGPLDEDGVFGQRTASAVKLFQVRRGLTVDGIVGPQTWAALGVLPDVTAGTASSPLTAAALEQATRSLGVRERTRNRGPEVDAFVASVGLNPEGQHAWCQAFVYWCFDRAAAAVGAPNPCARTGSVMKHWQAIQNKIKVVTFAEAAEEPGLIKPGMLFAVDYGHGMGHTGFVAGQHQGGLVTIEGNTSVAGSREGDGVYRRTRSFLSVNLGFVDYGEPVGP
jgi:peptidoglycan hydrolase-like protein with peptidoglycan-binding domain